MQIETLFQSFPQRMKPTPPGRNEFDFKVNRYSGRLADARDVMFITETVRVRGGTPYSWTGELALPDVSAGTLRSIACKVGIEGELPASRGELRDFMKQVAADRLDFGRLFGRALEDAVTVCGRGIGGRFVEHLRSDPAAMHAALLAALQDHKLFITRVELRPTYYDSAVARDVADETVGLAVRSRETLEENRVGFKARLVWGRETGQVVARLAYRGSIEGAEPEGPPQTALVPGQVQPMEAWFRMILAEELGRESLVDIRNNEPAMMARVREAVSERLGRGTGRVVESLVLNLVAGATPVRPERALQFREVYPIVGIRSGGLEVQHTIRYLMADRDRWRSAGEHDAEILLHQEVVEATKVYLNDKRFEDVVAVYFDPAKSVELSQEVERRVAPVAENNGYRLVSASLILAIPQHDFIDGFEVNLPESRYSLSEPHLQPPMLVSAVVQVADGGRFASALGRHEQFEEIVREAVEQTLRDTLRRTTAIAYFGSAYVNGLPVSRPADAGGTPLDLVDPFTASLQGALNTVLSDRFGLKLARFDLKPGEDPIIARMQELANRTIPYRPEPFRFERGDSFTELTLNVSASVFVLGLSAGHWSSFQYSVPRFPTVAEHEEEIRRVLTEAIGLLQQALLMDDREGLVSGRMHNHVIEYFCGRMRQYYGLEVRLHPLTLAVVRPSLDQTSALIVRGLHDELANLLAQRANLGSGEDAAAARERLTAQIATVRAELDMESRRREKDIRNTQIVQVSQDLATGLLTAPEDTSAAA